MTRSVTALKTARENLRFVTQFDVRCNRDDIVRRVAAWDAQVARMRKKSSPLESKSSRQLWLSFAADRSSFLRTHWPKK